MSNESVLFEVNPDTEGILSVKKELEKTACKDTVLLSNLDFSESIFRTNPLSQAVILEVKGQWQCLRIGKSSEVVYIVSSENGNPRIDCCIYDGTDEIQGIKSIYFSVHSCQDEIKSCFTAAEDAMKSKLQAFKITCNRFSFTYTTVALPDEITTIQTKCRFNLGSNMTVEALLERKCWMQREKSDSNELIACLDFLIQKYLTVPSAPKYNCSFILQGNKEMVEIISKWSNYELMKQYIVIQEGCSKVSIYPPLE